MYKKVKKIPTLLALLLLIVGLGGTMFLIERRTNFSTEANPNQEPNRVQLSNVSDSQFTLSWFTKEKSTGIIIYGESANKLNGIALDDRDSNKPNEYVTHHITVRNLKPQATYYYKIISHGKSFQNINKPYKLTLPAKIDALGNLEPAYGNVLNNLNMPAEGAIVYLTLTDSQLISTLVKPSGNWLLPLNTLRTSDLSSIIQSSNIFEEYIDIIASINFNDLAKIKTTTSNDSPVPTAFMGNTYNFSGSGTNDNQEDFTNKGDNEVLGKQTNTVDIISPEEGATFVSTKPLFRGTGIPFKEVIITVKSEKLITASVKVNKDGLWSWTPLKDLGAGKHLFIINTIGEDGEKITQQRNFLVFKSGTQVLGEATPSGTIAVPTPTTRPNTTVTPTTSSRVTPTPSPTGVNLSPTLRPLATITPTPTTALKPGNLNTTLTILGAGLILIFIGFAKIIISL